MKQRQAASRRCRRRHCAGGSPVQALGGGVDAAFHAPPQPGGQLFQPFMTTKQQGMGVGLSISRTIIEAHGGRIWVESNPTGGTIFKFTLPVVKPEDLTDDE